MTTRKTSTSASVLKCNAALLARGGRRIPGGYLQPDAALALSELVTAGYGPSPVAVIVNALFDARKKLSRKS